MIDGGVMRNCQGKEFWMTRRYSLFETRFRSISAIALITAAAGLIAPAQAAPLAHGKAMTAPSQILQVRDGCGQGMRYSERRDGCVEDFDEGPRGYYPPPPPPDYDRRPPPPPMYDRRPPPPPEYSRGPDRGDGDVAAGALIGGAVGALIGSSIRNDGRR
jgi:hypothetical protein